MADAVTTGLSRQLTVQFPGPMSSRSVRNHAGSSRQRTAGDDHFSVVCMSSHRLQAASRRQRPARWSSSKTSAWKAADVGIFPLFSRSGHTSDLRLGTSVVRRLPGKQQIYGSFLSFFCGPAILRGKTSAWKAADVGIFPRFSRSSHTSDLRLGTPV